MKIISADITGSFIFNGSNLTDTLGTSTEWSSSLATRTSDLESKTGSYATTGSNQFSGSQTVSGSLIVTEQIVAQTLNVQQVTSSVVYSSGSNVFGNSLSNTQQFTGSIQASGSSHSLIGDVLVGTSIPNPSLDSVFVVRNPNGLGLNANIELRSSNESSIYFNTKEDGTLADDYAQIFGGYGVGIKAGWPGDFSFVLLYNTLHHNTTFQTNGTEKMRITSDGRIGIGTTSPDTKLTLKISSPNAAIANIVSTTGNNLFNFISNDTSGNAILDMGRNTESGIYSAGHIRLRTDGDSWIQGGRIGIGTTTPSYLLDVAGSTRVRVNRSGDWATVIQNINTTDGYGLYVEGANNENTYLIGAHNGTAYKMVLTGAGNLIIGTTSNVGERVFVEGNIRLSSGSSFKATYNSTNDYHAALSWATLQLGNNGDNRIIGGRTVAGGNLKFYVNNTNDATSYSTTPDGILAMTIANTGKVGIGTTSPATKLALGGYNGARLPYIVGTSYTFGEGGITVPSSNNANAAIGGGIDLTNNTYSVGAFSPIISFSSLSSNSSYNNAYAGIWGIVSGEGADANWIVGHLAFGTGGGAGITERMRITNNGYVGIGTTTPTSLLHINGSTTGAILKLQNTATVTTDQGPSIQFISANQVGGQNFESGYIQSIWQTEGNAFGLRFATKPADGAQTERMRIKSDGDVNIKSGVITTGATFTISSLNTNTVIISKAYSGLVVIRDNTNGGSAVWLADPNQGFTQIANNMPGTFSMSYSSGVTYIQKNSGSVPASYSVAFYSNALG